MGSGDTMNETNTAISLASVRDLVQNLGCRIQILSFFIGYLWYDLKVLGLMYE